MPGFFITNTKEIPNLKNYDDSSCDRRTMIYKDWKISWNVLNKYMDDKIFYQDNDKIIILDGVILNKKDIMKEYNNTSWLDVVLEMSESSEVWFEKLRGSFSGAVMYKGSSEWVIFTDQCGAHLLLSAHIGNYFAIGSQLNYFSDWMKINKINRTINPNWAHDIVRYGCMRDAYSIINGVNRVYPGCYHKFNELGNEHEYIYYRVSKDISTHMTEDEIINKLDSLFHNAIKKITNKDKEYGYRTIVDISGGLDSRMNAVVASKEDAEQIIGLTYSQRGSDDQIISDKVVSNLQIEHIFYPLDGGNCLKDIDELVFMNCGFNYYFGITGGKKILETLNKDAFGCEIWGLLGDIYEGAMITDTGKKLEWNYPRFRMSAMHDDLKEPTEKHDFKDNELLWFYIRGMIMGMNTICIRQNFVEPITPYGDVEFMNFCFSLDEETRIKNHIYRKWMMTKYPDMAKIPYSGTGLPLTKTNVDELFLHLRNLFRRIYSIFAGDKKEWSMNPFDDWYNNNIELSKKIKKYYNDNIEYIKESTLKKEVIELFTQGNSIEKLMAVSIISSVKQYIAER